jgi:hypothetical protein
LLRYLGQEALDNPGVPIKEHQIATQVFGRPPEFDPRLDSTVRVQTGRLRTKLAEYRLNPGASDPIVVEIPKGTYQLLFHVVQVAESAVSDPVPRTAESPARRQTVWKIAFAGMAAIALILVLVLVLRPSTTMVESPAGPGAFVERFWQGLLANPSRPLVVFRAGVGETLAIHELDSVFLALGHSVPLRPIDRLSLADMAADDLIFVGSPPATGSVRGFRVEPMPSGAEKGEMAIINLHPLPGEPAQLIPSGTPATEDYAVISMEPGLSAERWLLTLAGTTSIGTEAAVDFVCRDDTVRNLLKKTGRARFAALLHTRIRDGQPVDTRLVAVHPEEK